VKPAAASQKKMSKNLTPADTARAVIEKYLVFFDGLKKEISLF